MSTTKKFGAMTFEEQKEFAVKINKCLKNNGLS